VVLRRLKPYPHVVPTDLSEPDRDEGSKIARRLIVAIKVFLFLWVVLMAMSGMFLWSLFI
jgi:cell division septal protein FtsQ